MAAALLGVALIMAAISYAMDKNRSAPTPAATAVPVKVAAGEDAEAAKEDDLEEATATSDSPSNP